MIGDIIIWFEILKNIYKGPNLQVVFFRCGVPLREQIKTLGSDPFGQIRCFKPYYSYLCKKICIYLKEDNYTETARYCIPCLFVCWSKALIRATVTWYVTCLQCHEITKSPWRGTCTGRGGINARIVSGMCSRGMRLVTSFLIVGYLLIIIWC